MRVGRPEGSEGEIASKIDLGGRWSTNECGASEGSLKTSQYKGHLGRLERIME